MRQIEVFDQLQHLVVLYTQPLRIVSLVPSLTELIADGFGLPGSLVGVTQYCVHPSNIKYKAQPVGGPKTVAMDRLKALRPDVVIASKEENLQEQVEEMRQFVPVFVTDVVDFPSALEAIQLLGKLLSVSEAAQKLTLAIRDTFSEYAPLREDLSVAYCIWKNPWMTIGHGTFIHEMLTFAGFHNVFACKGQRYPQITLKELEQAKPALVMLSSEPYTFTQTDQNELAEKLPASKIILVDGEMFSWYGNRMVKAPAYFKQLFKFVV